MDADDDFGIRLTFEDRGDHLLAVARGTYSLDGTMATFRAAVEECGRRRHHSLIVDVRGIDGNVSTTDRFDFGGRMAQTLANMNLRFALYSRPDQLTREGFLQSVMVNRGARVRVDSDLERIHAWLAQEAPPAG